jgi:hypothetical protein
MGAILSQKQFSETLSEQRGMTAEIVAECLRLYDGAASAAHSVLPNMPGLGFFSTKQERVAAFISACKQLDRLVEDGRVSRDEALNAIGLMTLSDGNFLKATKAFTSWAVPRYREDLTTNSETADYWLRSNVG